MATSGAELVRQMAAGDREAFALFYDRYAPLVFPLILRIVRERADASDVLQEVFWEAWRTADAYDPTRGSPEAWMVTRARTRAIDRIRSTRRRSEGRSGARSTGCRGRSARSSSSPTTPGSPRRRSPSGSSSRSGR